MLAGQSQCHVWDCLSKAAENGAEGLPKQMCVSQAVVVHTSISALQRQSQMHLCDLEASLVYITNSKTARAT